jgi:5-(carboxyamino)imidazole ribonucleotide synthase
MTGLAARAMGYDVHVLDPDRDCPARAVASTCITAAFDDIAAVAKLARGSDVVTIEIERVAVQAMENAATIVPVRPSAAVLGAVQNRENQKRWLTTGGFPIGEYYMAGSAAECESIVAGMGPSYVKASTGGYDGRGQVRVSGPAECAAAWAALRAERCVVERALDLAAEISVMIARSPSGQRVTFPVALNHHDDGQLTWSVIPAPIDAGLATRVTRLGADIADALGVEGLLAVEMFMARNGDVLVNELAPRPHNSFHHTIEACATSQFEQLVRAVCDLPLGATDLLRPAAIANILGNAWTPGSAPNFAAALAVPGTRLHLYGKREPRPARKMGHLAAIADTALEARARVVEAAGQLRASSTEAPVTRVPEARSLE